MGASLAEVETSGRSGRKGDDAGRRWSEKQRKVVSGGQRSEFRRQGRREEAFCRWEKDRNVLEGRKTHLATWRNEQKRKAPGWRDAARKKEEIWIQKNSKEGSVREGDEEGWIEVEKKRWRKNQDGGGRKVWKETSSNGSNKRKSMQEGIGRKEQHETEARINGHKQQDKQVQFAAISKPSATSWCSPQPTYAEVVRRKEAASMKEAEKTKAARDSVISLDQQFDKFFANLKRQSRCFKCFAKGHDSENCRSVRLCYKCFGTGHNGKFCRSSMGNNEDQHGLTQETQEESYKIIGTEEEPGENNSKDGQYAERIAAKEHMQT